MEGDVESSNPYGNRSLFGLHSRKFETGDSDPLSLAETKNHTPVKGKNMLNEQTFDKLYAMKLIGMAEGFKEQLEQPSFRDLSFEERFGMMVERQWSWKENKRLKRLLQDAKLKLQACIEDIDYRTPRAMEKSVILSLASCHWIRNHQNLLICGPTRRGQNLPCLCLRSEGLP